MTYEPFCVIAVDVQYDFLPGGSMPLTGADQILLPLNQLVSAADVVVATRDWHPANHFSFADDPLYEDGSWPPHCVQKTKGARIHPSINKYSDFVISKGTTRNPPDHYSAFAGKTLRPVETLQEIFERVPVDTIVIGGIGLAVPYTALDAAALGYHTIMPMNAAAPVFTQVGDPMERLRKAGVEVVERWEPNN